MDHLELKSIVQRLHEGECPICRSKLSYIANETHGGTLEKNGMSYKDEIIKENYYVYCETCGYESNAIQIGLKIIPIDRIDKYDIDWDKKYLESNTLIWGKDGENPFSNTKD